MQNKLSKNKLVKKKQVRKDKFYPSHLFGTLKAIFRGYFSKFFNFFNPEEILSLTDVK